MTKTSIESLRRQIAAQRASGAKWREVGAHYPGVPLGTLCRIAKDETYEPRTPRLRAKLGLALMPVEVEPCGHCGGVHVRKTCPSRMPSSRTQRSRERRAELNRIAQVAGWQSWSKYVSAVQRGAVRIERADSVG